jgi:hypothetical protein
MGVEMVFEALGAVGVVFETDPVEFEVALKGVDVDRVRGAHPAVDGQVGQAAEPGFGVFGTLERLDLDVAQVVEVNAETA